MEASGHARWFERLLSELQFELWIGDAAEIRTKRVRKQKTDRQDAQLILRLLLEDRFPRIWVPSWENRDLRQLLWHRHRMVQARNRIMNQLQAVALNEGLRCKKRLWRECGGSNWNHFVWLRGPAGICFGAQGGELLPLRRAGRIRNRLVRDRLAVGTKLFTGSTRPFAAGKK
jgi:transposase